MPVTSLTAEQLQGILNIADDAIVFTDEQQKIIYFNQGAERLFGWGRVEILHQDLNLLLPMRYRPGHHKLVSQFQKSPEASRKMAERQVIYAVRKDGSEFPAEASISKFQGAQGWMYAAILRDVSERKAYEEKLTAAKEKAEAAMQAKSMFLANMSHEIRTPLNAVIGMTSLMLNTAINDEQRDYVETIRGSSEALLAIINDLLDYSKIEIGKLDIERHPFDLRRCIEEAMDLLAPHASEKGIDLAYMIEEEVPATICSDATRIRQILVNLLSNAIKFTPHGEVVVTVSATPLDADRCELRFAVKDSGIGIPQERLQDIFESFTQVDASTTRKYGGTGLGLAITKRLAEIMGGSIAVESTVGQGSTFTCSIVAEASGELRAHAVLQEHSASFAGKRILIVDDNSTNRRILVKQSLLWGMVPSAAASAVEALDLVRHGHAFDVAVLDMSMPEMDGMQLAAEIRKFRDAKSLPLVMLTSVMHQPRHGHAAHIEFAAYLNKPIKPAALFAVLQRAMQIAAPAKAAPLPLPKPGEGRPLHILVAEDNTINQKVVRQLLSRLGYRADVVGNGMEALEAAERQQYDVILMDVQMPEVDGLEATRRLRQRFGRAYPPYIIAMTANAMPGDRERCFAAGMDAYVAKPVELEDLQRALAVVPQVNPAAVDAPSDEDELPVILPERIERLRDIEDENHPSLLSDVIDSFLQDTPASLDAIARAVETKDAKLLETSAHYLQSSIDFLGLERMREPCRTLERMGKDKRLDQAGTVLAQLQTEFALACEHLRQIRDQH